MSGNLGPSYYFGHGQDSDTDAARTRTQLGHGLRHFYPIFKFFIDRIDNKPIVEQFRRLSGDLTPQPKPQKPNQKPIKICLLNRAESQPTTPTTPSAPFGGGHPLAMLTGSGVPAGGTQQQSSSSNQATPVASRRDVPPSPDTIRGSKTFMRLNKELDQREKQENSEKMIDRENNGPRGSPNMYQPDPSCPINRSVRR